MALYVYSEVRLYYFIQGVSEVYVTAVAMCSVRIVKRNISIATVRIPKFQVTKHHVKQFKF